MVRTESFSLMTGTELILFFQEKFDEPNKKKNPEINLQ